MGRAITSVLSERISPTHKAGPTGCPTVCSLLYKTPGRPDPSTVAWLGVIAYYAPAFKTGVYPTPADSLWLWTRPHPKAATASSPSMARPTGWGNTDDNLYAFVTLASPATVTIYSGTNNGTWTLPAGVSKLSLASLPGVIGGKIVRGSSTVKLYDSTGQFTYIA